VGNTVPEEPKICPKCGKTMRMLEAVLSLPGYLDPLLDRKTDTGQKVSLKEAYPVEVYVCLDSCRYIELYAG
jgi:hypothetical protein